MEIEYFDEPRFDADIIELYRALEWYGLKGYTAEEIEKSNKNSFYSIYAYDGFKLVGLGRVASDGLTTAVMSGICVREDYRKRGIGEQIVSRLTHYCQSGSYQMNVQLFCEDGLKPWYVKQGFEEHGMMLRKVMVYPEESCRLRKDFREIYGIDDIVDINENFYWNDFVRFGELKYYSAKNARGETVPNIYLYMYTDDPVKLTVEIVFENVSRVTVCFEGIETLLDGFDIIDTGNLGLSTEKRYCIRTLYNRNLSFLCENFRILNVTADSWKTTIDWENLMDGGF
jgi:GNAT superfamily N-acetyltransferase